jgi:flagellar basal body-associated protein FliL
MGVQSKAAGKEDGFVAIVVVIVVLILAVWGFSALSGNKSDDTAAEPAKEPAKTSIVAAAEKIQVDKNIDICVYTDNRTEGSARLLVGKATTNFVNLAKTIDTSVCKTFQYGLFLKTVDSRGEESNTSVATFRLDDDNRAKFAAYDWNNVVNQNIGEQLKADGILTKINSNVESVSLDDVRYKGEQKELQ